LNNSFIERIRRCSRKSVALSSARIAAGKRVRILEQKALNSQTHVLSALVWQLALRGTSMRRVIAMEKKQYTTPTLVRLTPVDTMERLHGTAQPGSTTADDMLLRAVGAVPTRPAIIGIEVEVPVSSTAPSAVSLRGDHLRPEHFDVLRRCIGLVEAFLNTGVGGKAA
jgi:hypothetical protein